MKSYVEKRVGFSFYEADLTALRNLTLALRAQKVDLQRADAIRLLLFATSEVEMFAHTGLQLKADGKGSRSGQTVAKRDSFTVPKDFVDKLGRVADDFARKNVDVERTYIIRALLHAPHDAKQLARAWPQMEAKYPDKRSLRPTRRA